MIRLGITGNIACGKSLVGNYLQSKNISIIDSDQVVHDLLEQPSSGLKRQIQQVVKPFALELEEDGFMFRQSLAEIVFSNSMIKHQVENLIHPLVMKQTASFFEEQERAGAKLVANLIPLLYETGSKQRFNSVWLIYCEPQIQQTRLRERNPDWSNIQIEQRLQAQLPQAEKKRQADWTIDNSGEPAYTYAQIETALQKLLK